MPALVNYSGDDKYYKGGSLCSMDSSRSFSALDVYSRPSKRTRISDSHSLFANEEKNPSIEILPDECLYEIFRHLSSGQARSASACVSKHWLTLLSDVRSSEIVSNKVNSESSNGDELENDGLQAIARNCTNLQSISIKECPLIGDRGIATLCSSSSVLTKVKLQALNITDLSLAVIGRYGKAITSLALTSLPNMTPKGFWAMGNAKGLDSLTSLTVTWCYGITDISLEAIGHGCRVLKHMTLKKCCFVSDKGLVSFIKAARYLESLQLEECNRITQHGILGTLSNQSSKLKSFSLVKCMGIKDLVQEPVDFSESLHEFLKTFKVGLVKVNLSNCINLTNKVVVTLAEIHGGSLEMLNLDGCKKISDESLAAIAENCLFLKDLDVSKCCVTDSGVSCLSNVGHMNLRVLSLSGCSRVSNESVLSLEKLGQSLVGLNLQGCNRISSSVIESLVVNLWRWLGVNWGTQATHPLSPNIVVKLMKDNGFNKVKLFEAEPWVLDALRSSGIQVMLGIPNDFLAPLASSVSVAEEWVTKNVSAYVSRGVDIRYVAVGNEPFLSAYKNMFTNLTLPALENVQAAIIKAGLGRQVKVTVPLNADVYQSDSGVPSEGNFRPEIHDLMISIVKFISDNAAPIIINIYPFLSLYADPHFPVDFAFFDGTNAPVVDGSVSYMNVFDANYDTLVWTLEKNGFGNMPIIVGEIGWPTDGTPKRKTAPDVYVFGLIDEDAKSIDPGNFERHWGVFNYDGTVKYKLDFGNNRTLVPAKGVRYLPREWCVMRGLRSLRLGSNRLS
nr:glucan endo-1,3-beta-glucosidase 5-like [Tanacetum cinerariifolium]